MANLEDKLMDHNFDGIKEYDNPLPPWWVYLFLVTIIWSGLYLFYYDVSGIGPGSKDEYTAEMKEYQLQFASVAGSESAVNWNEANFEAVTEAAVIDAAKNLYIKNCASCHGNSGEGGIGPNLTDNYWIHGGSVNNIVKTIAVGVPEKGMIPWQKTFKSKDIVALASYILTLKGTNPPNAKAPQGDLFEEK